MLLFLFMCIDSAKIGPVSVQKNRSSPVRVWTGPVHNRELDQFDL